MPRAPDAVLLIHGTFSYRDEDLGSADPDRSDCRPAWWQANSEFVAELDRLLAGRARCWTDDACAVMPWSRRGLADRLEKWTIAGRTPFAWLRPRQRLGNRRLFAWSGANSESERRKAGRRLYEGLQALERENARRIAAGEAPISYHLVGHSHGGSVIWNALRLAAGRREGLPHLRSWTTLGTPFPTFRPIRGRWLVGLLGCWVTMTGLILGTRMFGWSGPKLSLPDGTAVGIPEYWRSIYHLSGFSPATWALVAILVLLSLWFVFAYVTWLARWLESRLEQRVSNMAWSRFGPLWLGLFSDLDEAIAGCQNTVGLYARGLVRLRWPGPPPIPRSGNLVELLILLPLRGLGWLWGWLFVPLSNWVVLPLAEWVISLVFRLKFQGADRLGSHLVLMSPEPFSRQHFPAEPTREPLPEPLARPLHTLAEDQIQAQVLTLRRRFAEDARGPQSPEELLRAYFSDIKLTNELIHNSYYDVDELRRCVAHHVLRCSPGSDSFEDPAASLAAEAQAWLAGIVNPQATLCVPRPKPPDTTPPWTRTLLAGCLVGLCLLTTWAMLSDLEGRYLDNLTAQIAASEADAIDPRLRRAFLLFRDRAERRLVAALAASEVAPRRRMIEFFEGVDGMQDATIDRVAALAFDGSAERAVRIPALRLLLKSRPDTAVAQALGKTLARRQTGPLGVPEKAHLMALVALGPAAVPTLDRLAKDGSPSMKVNAIGSLGQIGPPAAPALPTLVDGLGNSSLQPETFVAMAAIGQPAAAYLAGLGNLPDSDATATALCEAVGGMGPDGAPASGLLVRLLDHKEESIRIAAVTALRRLGEAGREGLIVALRNANPIVRFEAVRAFAQGTRGTIPVTELAEALDRKATEFTPDHSYHQAYRDAIRECLVSAGETAVPAVQRLLAHDNPDVRHTVLITLDMLGPKGAMAEPDLLALIERELAPGGEDATPLPASDPQSRPDSPARTAQDRRPASSRRVELDYYVFHVLEKIASASSSSSDRLWDMFTQNTPLLVRKDLLRAISKIGIRDESSLDRLLSEAATDPALADLGGRIRLAPQLVAEDAVGQRCFERLVAVARDASAPRPLRVAAIATLGTFGGRSVATLREYLESREDEIRETAVKTLGTMGPPAAPALDQLIALTSDKLQGRLYLDAIDALGSIGIPSAPVLECLVARLRGVHTLDVDAVEEERARNARRAAVSALIALNEPAVTPVLNAMKRGDRDDMDGHAAAIEVLRASGTKRDDVVEELARCVNNSRGRFMTNPTLALEVLGEIGTPAAVAALVDTIETNFNTEAQTSAEKALSTLTRPSGAVADALTAILRDEARAPRARIAAAHVLGGSDQPGLAVHEALLAVVLRPSDPPHDPAASIGAASTPEEKPRESLRATAARALARLGRPSEERAAALIARLGDGASRARRNGPGSATDPLAAMVLEALASELYDERDELRSRASELLAALARWADFRQAEPVLIDMVLTGDEGASRQAGVALEAIWTARRASHPVAAQSVLQTRPY